MVLKNNKNIGIVTFFRYTNYGTMLQAYALQKILQIRSPRENCVELIDYRIAEKNINFKQLLFIRFKRILIYITQIKKIVRLLSNSHNLELRKPLFDEFENIYLHTSKGHYDYYSDLVENPPLYDIYVTGSDQTWSPKIGFNDAFFLKFAPAEKKKAAYAPSIGVSGFTEEQRLFLKDRLSHYDIISCREAYGSNLLSQFVNKQVVPVLDPTLTLRVDQWRELSVTPIIKEKYILCYFIGDRNYYRKFAKQLSKQLNIPLYFIPVSYLDFSRNNNLLWRTGPKEFLGLIDNAEIICTDSFHGMVFSTNFNKTFYGFVKHKGTKAVDNPRISDFLKRMGLEDRLILDYHGEEISFQSIDYEKVNLKLEEERVNSYRVVDNILSL